MNIKSIGSKIKGNPTMVEGTVYSMLIICSISHFLNDMIQSIIPSIYPIVKDKFDFSFAQIGIITLVFQMTSSILQPFTGLYADKHPRPYALSIGMCFTLVGLLLLAFALSCNLSQDSMPISIPVPMPSPSACVSHWWACSCWLSPRIIF